MGCWYSTCHMSNLPILGGEKVVAILLAPKRSFECVSASSPDDYYSVIGSPIVGEYDEYGRLENITMSATMEAYLKTFSEGYVYTQADHSYSNSDETREYEKYAWLNIETFINDWLSYDLYVDCHDGKGLLQHVFVHKELYDNLIENVSKRIPYGEAKTYGELLDDKIERNLYFITKKNESYRKMLRDISSNKVSEEELSSFDYYRLSSEVHQINDWRWRSMDDFAKVYARTKDNNIIAEIRNYILWREVMLLSRKGYLCTSGRGSQSQEMMMHKLIAEFTLKKCQKLQGRKKNCVLEDTIFYCE